MHVFFSDKVCVVDGRGGFRKTGRYCPVLDGPDSKVECVLGLDRWVNNTVCVHSEISIELYISD